VQDIIIGFNSLLEAVKNAKHLYDMNNYVELRKILGSLEIGLAEANSKIAELIAENTALKEENRKLKAVKEEELEFRNNAYYDKGGNIPYCPGCYANKNVKVPLVDMEAIFSRMGNKKCPVCKISYFTD